MSSFVLKIGDLVYYPLRSNKFFKLTSSRYADTGFPLEIYFKEFSQTVSTEGKTNSFQNVPVVFPATQEWYEKLSHIYPNLEKPPTKKSSKEIIQALLDDKNAGVLCWVSDSITTPSGIDDNPIHLIIEISKNRYISFNGLDWEYATPITPIKTINQTVIDYVNGKIITEGGDD